MKANQLLDANSRDEDIDRLISSQCYNNLAGRREGRLKIEHDFLVDVLRVCKNCGFSISHEDGHGSFIISKWSESDARWLGESQSNSSMTSGQSQSYNNLLGMGWQFSRWDGENIIMELWKLDGIEGPSLFATTEINSSGNQSIIKNKYEKENHK